MIVAMAGQKGGSGKSTTAICVAAEALARGLRVLLVDSDPQGTCRTWGAVALEAGRVAPTVVAMVGAHLHRPGQLQGLLGNYDLAVIDCPPRQSDTQRAAMMVADLVVLPSGPSSGDVWALEESAVLVQEAQRVRPELRAAALLTRAVRGSVLGRGGRAALASVGLPVLKSRLGFRLAFQEAPTFGLGVVEYAPKSEAAAEVRALVDELGIGKRTKGGQKWQRKRRPRASK